jgi:hypothetical protein
MTHGRTTCRPTGLQAALAAALALAAAVPAVANFDFLEEEERRSRSSASVTPTTQSQQDPVDSLLDGMLRDREPAPVESTVNPTRPPAAVAVAPAGRLLREGSFVVDRVGQVRRTDDGQFVFGFQSTGPGVPAADAESPMTLVPNLNLMAVESALRSNPYHSFRVTGRVTEYRGRNHLILEKVVVLD